MQKLILVIIVGFIFTNCNKSYTPKPRGYFRIDLPEKQYKTTPDQLPYKFEYPKYSYLQQQPNSPTQQYWINIVFPLQNAKVHLSYKEVDNNLDKYMGDARGFVYKHTIKADAITEIPYVNSDASVYGLFYEIKGDAASNTQFYVTDSTKHFLRGALYFNVVPNKDSLAPVLDFINEDIVHLIETFEWK